jgi:hypothetical protein
MISDAYGSKAPDDRMAVGRIAVCFIPRERIGDPAGDPPPIQSEPRPTPSKDGLPGSIHHRRNS